MRKPRVLFLCVGNACRSIMAEALAHHFDRGCFEPLSAGVDPLEYIPPFTLEVLHEAGISTVGLYSKSLSEIRLHRIDYVVDLTEHKVARRVESSFSGKVISYPVRDPFGHDLETFRAVREELALFVREELPGLVCKGNRQWWSLFKKR